ncbi:MAG: hypothetical protein IJL67_07430 [Oscillospiraceae bacterium]|nr:hypothetical protein [Oscillospiraceae bacterium]
MKTKEDKIIDAIGGLSDENVMLTDRENASETNEREIEVHDESTRKISFRRTAFGTVAAAVVLAGGLAIWSKINTLDPFEPGDENSSTAFTDVVTGTAAENQVTDTSETDISEKPKNTVIVTVADTSVTMITEAEETAPVTSTKTEASVTDSSAESVKYDKPSSESTQESQIKIVDGELLKSEDLVDFNSVSELNYYIDYDKEWAETHDSDTWGYNMRNLLDQIGSAELENIYYRADYLFRLRSPEKIIMFEGYNYSASVIFSDQESGLGQYGSTGFNYDSFINDLHEVFTDECLNTKTNFKDSTSFRKYGDELFCTRGSKGGDVTLLYTEYTLEKQDENEIIITQIDYHDDSAIGNPISSDDFTPEMRNSDSLRKEYGQFRFVKTDAGWRIADFPKSRY